VVAVFPHDVIIRNMLTTVIPNTAERVETVAAAAATVAAAAAEGGPKEGERAFTANKGRMHNRKP